MEHIGETPRHVGSPNFNTQLYMAAPWLKHINNKTDQMRRKLRDGSIRLWDEFFKSMKVRKRSINELMYLHYIYEIG